MDLLFGRFYIKNASNNSIMTRQSSFELLRLIAMLMVMICHAVGYVQETDLVGIAGVSKLAIGQLCLICVNVFVMISG